MLQLDGPPRHAGLEYALRMPYARHFVTVSESRLLYEKPLERPVAPAMAEAPALTEALRQFEADLKAASEVAAPLRLHAFDRLLRQVAALYAVATTPAQQERIGAAIAQIEEAMQKTTDADERRAFIDRAFERDRQFWGGLRMPLTQLPWINYMMLAKGSAERSAITAAETEVTEALVKSDPDLQAIGTQIQVLEQANEKEPTPARTRQIDALAARGQARIQLLLRQPDQQRALATHRDEALRRAYARIDRDVAQWLKDPTTIPADQRRFILALPLAKLTKLPPVDKDGPERYVYVERPSTDKTQWELQPRQIGTQPFITLRCLAGPDAGTTLTRPAQEILTAVTNDALDPLLKVAREARARSPRAHPERRALNDFDLPKDQDIVCIRVFPKTIDSTLQTNVLGSTLFAQAVQSRYQNRDRAVVVPPLLATDDPAKDVPALVENIRRDRGGKKLTVVLNINAHGTRAGFEFPQPWDVGAMIAGSGDAYVLHTMACHGAGLREHLQANVKKQPAIAPRLFASFVTQPELPTAPLQGYGRRGGVADHGTSVSTDYELRFIRALLDPRIPGWGAAHTTADTATEEAGGLHNPEALMGEQLFTRLPTPSATESAAA